MVRRSARFAKTALRPVAAAALFALLMAGAKTSAQERPESPNEPVDAPSSRVEATSSVDDAENPSPPINVVSRERETEAAPQRLFMVVRTKPFQKQDEVEIKIELGLKNTEGVECGTVQVKPISQSAYEALSALITHGPLPGAMKGDITVAPYVEDSALWEINTGDPDDRLQKASLTVEGPDKREQSLEHEVAERSKHEAPLRYYKPGVYLLRLPPSSRPTKCTLTLKRPDGEAREVPFVWPELDRYYVIVMNDFWGDPAPLFETLKDGSKVGGVPFEDIGEPKPTTLVLASLKEIESTIAQGWPQPTTFRAVTPLPPNTFPKRAWMLFPLTKEQSDEELAAALALVERDGFKALPEYIRKRGVEADKEAMLAPGNPPQWYEMTREGEEEAFIRMLELDRVAEWKQSQPAPETFRLLVYEFDDGAVRLPIRFSPGANKQPSYVVDEAVEAWPIGLRELKRLPEGDTP